MYISSRFISFSLPPVYGNLFALQILAVISNVIDIKMICSFEMFSFMSDVEDIKTHGFCNFALHQICITTSTSAGLEQTLPWIFYHKVMGVSTFFLFVEGKAASHDVSKVLETVPVS